jgi:ABC-2 type transport system ATP-binding protein
MIHKGQKVLDGTLHEIQDQYGSDTIRIQTEAGPAIYKGIKEIEKVTDFGREQEIKIGQEADPQKILTQIISKTSINKFEITRPSLHDIFVRIARPEKENQHA